MYRRIAEIQLSNKTEIPSIFICSWFVEQQLAIFLHIKIGFFVFLRFLVACGDDSLWQHLRFILFNA